MPRLLILCEHPTLLGGERSMLSVLPAVMAAGFDVQVAAPSNGTLADAVVAAGAKLADWRVRNADGVRRPLAELRADLSTLLKRSRPDLLHANSLSMARVAGPVAAQAGVPSIGHLRDIVRLSRQAMDDLNYHRRLIAVSQATRDYHVAQGLDAQRCVVVHNGVDLEAFRPRAATAYLHRELCLADSVRFITTIGQIGLRKGTEVALAAAKQVFADHANVHWIVVGQRTSDKEESIAFERQLHAAANEPPLKGRVHFLGMRNDVAQLLNECVLLVHAAHQEPLGRVLLEAAACGLAVVATDAGGTREIFPTKRDGAVLVPIDNAYAIARAMIRLLSDDAWCESLSIAARQRAEAAFDVRVAARRLIEQYQMNI